MSRRPGYRASQAAPRRKKPIQRRGGGVSPNFGSPLLYNPLVFWEGSSQTNDGGGNVLTAVDLSGNGRDGTTSIYCVETTLNGEPAFGFGGIAQGRITSDAALTLGAGPWHISAVLQINTARSNCVYVDFNSSSTEIWSEGTTSTDLDGRIGTATLAGPTLGTGVPALVTLYRPSGSGCFLYVDGTEVASAPAAIYEPTSQVFSIGSRVGGSFWTISAIGAMWAARSVPDFASDLAYATKFGVVP